MRDGGPAAWAELKFEPPAAFVRAMLECVEFSLQQCHVALIEVGDGCERRAQATLTESAVTDLTNFRISTHLIADGTTGTTAFVKFAPGSFTVKLGYLQGADAIALF